MLFRPLALVVSATTEPEFVNVQGAQESIPWESIPPGWKSIPGLLKGLQMMLRGPILEAAMGWGGLRTCRNQVGIE
jgi:hypothetical protein